MTIILAMSRSGSGSPLGFLYIRAKAKATFYRPHEVAKVMFSQACACPQGGWSRGGVVWGGCLVWGVGAWSGGLVVSQHALRQTPSPGETATAADGTHPTGMHSCFFDLLPLTHPCSINAQIGNNVTDRK